MLFVQGPQSEPSRHRSSLKKSPFIDRQFQLRYTLLMLGASLVGVVATFVPISFFINQNYEIFIGLAFDHSPRIIQSLEREQIWVNTTLMAVFVGLFAFFFALTFRMTARIVGPLKILRNHLVLATRGRYDLPLIRIRDTDEFHDLIESYNYFYLSSQRNMRREIEFLKRIAIDPRNRDSYLAWRQLLVEKSRQLGDRDLESSIIETVEPASPAPDSRHVS